MPGKISFHFDDGYKTFYTEAFPIFKEMGAVGCLAVTAAPVSMTFEEILEMQSAGWEVMSHSKSHIRMKEKIDTDIAEEEIADSKRILEEKGLVIKQFVTPYSECHRAFETVIQKHYDAAFTVYKNSAEESIEDLVISRPTNAYRLNRAVMCGKTAEDLKKYVDYVSQNDAWLILYDHDIGAGNNVTSQILKDVLAYCKEKGVEILTSSEALEKEKCKTKIIREGFDGIRCFVHTRSAVGDNRILMTSQLMQVAGSDCFECLQANYSSDGGRSWSGFFPNECFSERYHDGVRTVCSDMTPLYHKKTGKFIVTGHTVDYYADSIYPVDTVRRARDVSYSVFDEEKMKFTEVKFLKKPHPRFADCGSGCSQCYELENGDLLVPVAFSEPLLGGKEISRVSVMRCSFDGEELLFKDMGRALVVSDEERGIGEASVMFCCGRYYLTVRGNNYGYISVGEDGINFTDPKKWRWENGETVPTYNTQSHFFTLGDRLYLVYTRRDGKNDHVFRNRAPLYCAEVDKDSLTLICGSEFAVVPERGARLGNFGVCRMNENTAIVTASEWMQPQGCEKYGSNNAVWLSEIKNQDL